MKLGSKKRRWARYAAPVVLLSALTLGCGSSNNDFVFRGNNPVQTVNTGNLAVELQLVNTRAVATNVSTIEIRLIQNNEVVIEREFLRAQSGTEQTLNIDNVPVGDYQLQMSLLGENGELLGTFESTVSITPGSTTTIDDPDYTPLTFVASGTRTVQLPVNSRPQNVTAADFNEDGIIDLAVVGQDSDLVYVLIGNADGSYQSPAELTGTDYGREIISADLDDDTHVDLVVANWGDQEVSIYYGNGDGTFENEVELDVDGSQHSVKAADVNGDNDLDLIIADDGDDEVEIYLGDGNRNFSAQPSVGHSRDWLNRVLVEDFNGDNDPDLAFQDFETGELFIALGNGDGTFGAVATYAGTATRPWNLTAGDIDGDGDLDIIQGSRNGDVAPVHLNNGSGVFSQTDDAQTGGDVIWVELADVTGDGVLDLVAGCLDEDGIFTSVGNGDGTFQPASDAFLQAGLGPFSFIVQDIDLDSVLDIVTVNRGNYGNLGSQDGGPASLSIFYGE